MKFECPHCHQRIEADETFAEATVACPTCQQTFVAPKIPSAESCESQGGSRADSLTEKEFDFTLTDEEWREAEEQDRARAEKQRAREHEELASEDLATSAPKAPPDPSSEAEILHAEETVWLVEPAKGSIKKHIPSILKRIGWPKNQLCWRCAAHPAESGSEVIERISVKYDGSEVEGIFLPGSYYMAGYVCVPRCSLCVVGQQAEFDAGNNTAGLGCLGLVGVIAFAFLAQSEKAIRFCPAWLAWTLTGVCAGLFLYGIVRSNMQQKQKREELMAQGLRLEPHPDIKRAEDALRKKLWLVLEAFARGLKRNK